MELYPREYMLAGIIALMSVAGYLFLKSSGDSKSERAEIMLSGFLGGVFLVTGVVKFFDPFTTMFAKQIAMSWIPFPAVSKWIGLSGEIVAGVMMFLLAFYRTRVSPKLVHYAFLFANSVILVVMSVALSIHLHYDVPAAVLPFGLKPPVLSFIIICLAARTMRIHRVNRYKLRRTARYNNGNETKINNSFNVSEGQEYHEQLDRIKFNPDLKSEMQIQSKGLVS